ncbi:hypothetical protein NWFMUON74_09360 [Nocardia wallacei]|uniref:Lipoprotein n=3 Tax=Nocardia wallacei TaxID=480035 RepID=A0A7G1KIC7_9NOCA|nr:hypothetical protein NWFMUON74_09360 [Nocardia wallacei]
MHRTVKGLLAVCLTAAVTTACGSEQSAAPTADPPVDITKLDVGPYATTPRKLDAPSGMPVARFMEAERLAGVLPLPIEIDPALRYGEPGLVHAFLEVSDAYHLSPMFRWLDEKQFNTAAPNFVAGFSTSASSDKKQALSYELVNSVLIFPDDSSARSAATELSKAGFYDEDAEPTSLDKYPEAVARRQPTRQTLVSWLASGKFVIVTIAQHHENRILGVSDFRPLATVTEKAIAATLPTLEKFVPTPPDKLMTIPVDRENMRSRSLRRPEGDGFTNIPGAYDVHGALQFAEDVEESRRHYAQAGVDLVALDGADLFRTKDATAARRLFEENTQSTRFLRHAPTPVGLPNARCFEYKGPSLGYLRYTCHLHYGRFMASVASNQLQDVQQRLSAQYAILATSK